MITRFFFGPDAANVACAADERSQIAVRFMGSNVTLPKPGSTIALRLNGGSQSEMPLHWGRIDLV